MDRIVAVEWLAMAFARGDGGDAAELREALERALDASSRVVRSRQGVVTVVREAPPLSDAERFVEAIRASVATTLADPSVSAGLAVPRRRISGLTTSALQAEQALLLGRALRGEGRTTAFADLGPYCFVLGQPPSDLRQFCDRVLGPLASEDDERHDDLVRTLEAYLQSHGSLNAVARALFLHRNTVRQRLRRIAQLTGADLNDAESRLALHLAVLGRRALAEMYAR
jgi:purine catabolism regulator